MEQLQDTGPFLKSIRFGGSFGLAVDKKKREMNYLSVKCWVYTGVCMWWLVWLGSEQTSQTSQLV